jgi:VanZ family protein
MSAWFILWAIVVMTLGPLSVRPHTPVSADFDRVVAYAVLSLAFAFAYPRRVYLVAVALVVAAGGLECAQSLVPGRDGRLEDFRFKLAAQSLVSPPRD